MNIASNRITENVRDADSKKVPVFPGYIESTKLIERLLVGGKQTFVSPSKIR